MSCPTCCHLLISGSFCRTRFLENLAASQKEKISAMAKGQIDIFTEVALGHTATVFPPRGDGSVCEPDTELTATGTQLSCMPEPKSTSQEGQRASAGESSLRVEACWVTREAAAFLFSCSVISSSYL